MIHCRALAPVLVLSATLTVSGCGSNSTDEQRDLDVLVADALDTSPASILMEKQRGFLRALADTAGDPTPFMSTGVEVVDWADESTQPSSGPGGSAWGQDYLRTLSDRLPRTYGEISTLEVQLERPDHAVVIASHPAVAPTITHWRSVGLDWKVVLFILNVPDDVLAQVRERSGMRPQP
jgi:hypothetical protein